tara:strand:+ start:554 stop:1108 length:555 start_codon:yes stop_codon:yes gene_type:complete
MNSINNYNISAIDNKFNPTNYNKKFNGRVDVHNYNPYDKFKLYDRIKVENKSTDYRNALQGSWSNCELSKKYFSKENINLIQNILKQKVYKQSNNYYEIGNQNENALKMNMRNIYFQYSKNLPNNIQEQVSELNEILTNKLVPEIISEATAYIKYKRDISTLAVPIDRPKSTYHNKLLEFKSFF